MKFGYDSAILDIAPDLVAGVVWCRGLNNSGVRAEIDALLGEAEEAVIARYPTPPDIALDPAIAGWRQVYSSLGLKPNRYPCAAESLIRRVVTVGPAPRISPLVDLCNAASLTFAIPVAPFDLIHAEGDCVVRLATGDEQFRSIGSDALEPIPPGEAVYADDTPEVLSRRWNWRQTAKGAITAVSSDILITTEAVHPEARAAVEGVLAILVDGITKHLAGDIESDTLTADNAWSKRTRRDRKP